MSLWVDKYRPLTLSQLDYHSNLSETLKNISSFNDFPHLLFYGPNGAGKKTRIHAVLREIFGQAVDKTNVSHKAFQTPSGTKLDIHVVSSNFHTELTPSDVGVQDRVVIQEVIKEMAQTQQIDANSSRRFKVVVLHQADAMSKDAQHGLRRTMEKYMKNMRLILCCENTSKILPPIQSRCLLIRVGAPSLQEVSFSLQKVARQEHFDLKDEMALKIAEASERNLRKAILMLESFYVQSNGKISNDAQIPIPEWEAFIRQVAQSIIEEQSPQKLAQVRTKIYELLAHCIPAETIMKYLTKSLLDLLDQTLKSEIVYQAAFYEHRLRLGSKPIFHIEAFIAKFMSIYKRYLLDMLD